MLETIEKTLADVATGASAPRSLLKLQFLNQNSFFVFERFVQALLTAYQRASVSDRDWQALEDFSVRLPVQWSGEANRRRLALRYILPALARFHPARKLVLTDAEIARLSANHGCVEFDPARRIRPEEYASNCATFVSFYDQFLGSEYTPPVMTGADALSDFDQLYFRLLRDHFNLTLDDDLFVSEERRRIRTLVYELYSNIVVHAMPPLKRAEPVDLINHATIRFVRISTILFANSDQLRAHLVKYFGPHRHVREYGASFSRPRTTSRASGIRFVRINIQDNGPGIVQHFARLRQIPPSETTNELFLNILTTQMSSTDVAGAGLGTQNAIDAICDLNGFLSVRSDAYWGTASSVQRKLSTVEPSDFALAAARGTSITAVFPAAVRKSI